MVDYIQSLIQEFENSANAKVAAGQKAYMKNKFEFYGLSSNERRNIQSIFLKKDFLPLRDEKDAIIKKLWESEYRELHYFAQELAENYIKKAERKDIELLEYMISHQSWWDTVDFISVKLVGLYFKIYPDSIESITQKWMKSGNIWLQRSCLLFQLKYKKELDKDLLAAFIKELIGSKEFFINKAIGWVLREYSRTNANWVIEFVNKNPELNNLSKREALRLIKENG